MAKISDILNQTAHRPWKISARKWQWYQEWNQAVFLHWIVPEHLIRPLVPARLSLDTFGGQTWVSLVAFTMQKIRPKNLPALSVISDFYEINLRTYVTIDNKPGVYFLNIEAGKLLSVWIARTLSGLPYEKSTIERIQVGNSCHYKSENPKKNFSLDISFTINDDKFLKTQSDHWMTERYCLYLDKGRELYRFDVHHKEWEIKKIRIDALKIHYPLNTGLTLATQPDLFHYSEGVQVLAWGEEIV